MLDVMYKVPSDKTIKQIVVGVKDNKLNMEIIRENKDEKVAN